MYSLEYNLVIKTRKIIGGRLLRFFLGGHKKYKKQIKPNYSLMFLGQSARDLSKNVHEENK